MTLLAWGAGLERQGVKAVLAEGIRQELVHGAVTLDPALAGKGFRHDIYSEMGLSAGSGAGMPGVKMGLVVDLQFGRTKLARHDFDDPVLQGHARYFPFTAAPAACRFAASQQ